jgi:hypothetical protein
LTLATATSSSIDFPADAIGKRIDQAVAQAVGLLPTVSAEELAADRGTGGTGRPPHHPVRSHQSVGLCPSTAKRVMPALSMAAMTLATAPYLTDSSELK